MANAQVQDAVMRRLEIIGEAAKHVPEEVRKAYPHVPWKTIVGLRDVLIHEYFGVQTERIWKVIQENIPALEKDMPAIKRDLAKKS